MNEADLLDRINDDIRLSVAQTVIYLEGTSDPEFLFALLGLPSSPGDGLHRGVLVRGLKDEGSRKGSGSSSVRSLVEVASRHRLTGIFGVIDGDGRSLAELAPAFDPPHSGPLFYWKAYCIENLMAKTGWPPAWGDEPDWPAELANYGPYVALNRIGSKARAILKDLGLEKFSNPVLGAALRPSAEIATALASGKARFLSFDVEREYGEELTAYEAAAHRSLDEVHALLNGKWLFRHMAPTVSKRDPDLCRFEWLAHARSRGGLAEVRDWWERVTGSPP